MAYQRNLFLCSHCYALLSSNNFSRIFSQKLSLATIVEKEDGVERIEFLSTIAPLMAQAEASISSPTVKPRLRTSFPVTWQWNLLNSG